MCGRRMQCDDVEDLFAVLDAATGLDLVAEHDLLGGIVECGNKTERAVAIDRPSGKRARDLDDVLLRVAAFDAERVQFEQLPSVVFVQPTDALLSRRRIARLIRLRAWHDWHATC